jgi:hypothetical protein
LSSSRSSVAGIRSALTLSVDIEEASMKSLRPLRVLAIVMIAAMCGVVAAREPGGDRTIKVSGSGVDGMTGAVVHSKESTATGTVQRSTEIVELEGDLKGRVLYHVTSAVDSTKGTLVNTGDQVFSGTVAGSAPVMIHDNRFRFDANLATGAESGQVYLFNSIAGPKVRCRLDVVGTGLNQKGDPTFTYTGDCTFQGR